MRRKAKVSATCLFGTGRQSSEAQRCHAYLYCTFNNIMIGLMIWSTPYKKSISRTEGDKEGSQGPSTFKYLLHLNRKPSLQGSRPKTDAQYEATGVNGAQFQYTTRTEPSSYHL